MKTFIYMKVFMAGMAYPSIPKLINVITIKQCYEMKAISNTELISFDFNLLILINKTNVRFHALFHVILSCIYL